MKVKTKGKEIKMNAEEEVVIENKVGITTTTSNKMPVENNNYTRKRKLIIMVETKLIVKSNQLKYQKLRMN